MGQALVNRTDPLVFGPFRLDPKTGRLWRGDIGLTLRPRTFDVLCYLAERLDQLVSADELFAQVWHRTHVSPSALRVSIQEIRAVLGDSAQTPRYLETVRGRGYRLLRGAPEKPVPAGSETGCNAQRPVVGRERELRQLGRLLERSISGARQIALISGEAGIGKTTLVDTFVDRIRANSELCIGRGQCLEHHGEGEAYLPVLEALGRLGRSPAGVTVKAVLRQFAPGWMMHLPGLTSQTERQQLGARRTTRQRMLRELAEALETLTADILVVLVLEDLHWSDPSTVDLLAALARRREAARLMVLGTYRPADARLHANPLLACLQELRAHEQAVELTLCGLELSDVAAYGRSRLGGPLTARTGAFLHRQSAGNALFLANLLEHLVQQGKIRKVDGRWTLLNNTVDSVPIPQRLGLLIDRQFEQLPPPMQRALEVASIVGETFPAAAVAAGARQALDTIDELCAAIVRLGGFLEAGGLATWPDGTVSGRYRFRHALVRQAVYGRLGAGPRAALHGRIGRCLEAAFGARAADIAATLAFHFQQGRDVPRALHYLQLSAEQALLRTAYTEAITHCKAALALLRSLPQTPERAQKELNLLIVLRSALVPAKGYRAPEIEDIYRRARTLCDQLEEGPPLVLALGGLVRFYWHIRAEVQPAIEVAQRQLDLAKRLRDTILILRAQCNLGPLLYTAGAFASARDYLQSAVQQCSAHPGNDPNGPTAFWDYQVESRGYLALTLWHLGYPDQAASYVRDTLALLRDADQPFSLAGALMFAAILSELCGESESTRAYAESLSTLATEQDYPHWSAIGGILQGAALARVGEHERGIALIRRGIAVHRDLTGLGLPLYLALLAESYGRAGRFDEGLTTINEALSLTERTGEQHHLADLHRVRGELLRACSPTDHGEAEACFQRALALSRSQQSKALTLRAGIQLCLLWQQQGRRDEAHRLVAGIYSLFTEGFDTADLRTSRALLQTR